MAKTVVILGAGWAGLPLAHKLLKYTLAKMASELKVILVSPNSHFFWNVAATRGIIPGEIPDDQLFLPIQKAFDQYPADAFEFVLGRADAIKPDANTVDISCNDGSSRSVPYDQLVIATGSRVSSNLPLKLVGSHEDTLSAWHDLQNQVSASQSIIVCGAGATGIEVAGELGAKYGKAKDITLVASGERLLPEALPSLSSSLDKDLKKLGVEVLYKTRVESSSAVDGGKTEVVLSSGSKVVVDLYLPLHGISVNTSFVPAEFLDEGGSVKLDRQMRVEGTENIWGIGDIGNVEAKQLTVTDNQIIHLAGALDAVLTGTGSAKEYQPDSKKMIFLSLGKSMATGQIGNWKLFSIMVSWVKGRRLFVDTAEGYVGGKHLRHAKM